MNGSGKAVRRETASPVLDRRVRRTRAALTQALIELVLEKRYRSITVQDLLDRADVGRSTFYSHYRGKDDLLLRSFEAMLEMLDGCVDADTDRQRLAPVEELFHHVGDFRDFHRALARARKIDLLFHAGAISTSRSIARRIAALTPPPAAAGSELEATAHACAGALFALLRWWLDQQSPPSPRQMDELFHRLVLPGVARTR
jgi:AcrR family transcriptional regulator